MALVRIEGGQRSGTVRRGNLSAIVRELHLHGPLSRSELVASTGLTRSAIRGLTRELVAAGLVVEERSDPLGVPGRPSALVEPVAQGAVTLGLGIFVDALSAAVVGFGGTVLETASMDRPPRPQSAGEIADELRRLVSGLSTWRAAEANAVGIGVAVVGVVRREDGFVSMAPNLGWRDVPLGDELTRTLEPEVPMIFANEADLGALAEARRGVARGVDHVLYVSGEVGVGGGVLVDGQPMTGVAGYAGEVGHIPFDPDGLECRCGARGCWETRIGEEAILRLAGHPADGGAAAVEAVLAEARAGDARALAALDEVGRWLGIGLAGLVNTLHPSLIVLGGRFAWIHPFVAETIDRELDRRALRAPRRLVTVEPSRLGLDAPLAGAAEIAFDPFLADPTSLTARPAPSTTVRKRLASA